MGERNAQPHLDPDATLSPRQLSLVALCDTHALLIGDKRTCAGEDAAVYFQLRHADDAEESPASVEPSRYCAVTFAQDHRYVYPLYDTLAAAKAAAVEHVGDDIYAELPLEVVDLDTGKCWKAEIATKWSPGMPR